MLKDKDFRALETEISRIYSDIETSLVRRICRWIRSNPDSTLDIEDWRMRKISGVGVMALDIQSLLSEESASAEKSLLGAVQKAVDKSVSSDASLYKAIIKHQGEDASIVLNVLASDAQKARVSAVVKNARKALNLTNTLAKEASQQSFIDAVNSAYIGGM